MEVQAIGYIRTAGQYFRSFTEVDDEIIDTNWAGSPDPVGAHIAGHDSRPIQKSIFDERDGAWASFTQVKNDVLDAAGRSEGILNVTFMMFDVGPSGISPNMGNATLMVDIDCGHVPSLEFAGSRQAWLLDEQSFRGGVAANVLGGWSVAHDQRRSLTIEAPNVEITWTPTGSMQGSFQVSHPRGEYAQDFAGPMWQRLQSTGGAYELRLNDYDGVPEPDSPCPGAGSQPTCYSGGFHATVGAFQELETLDDL